MRDYTVLWTFVGNYSNKCMNIRAKSAAEAVDEICMMFGGDEFRAKATIYVFEAAPIMVLRKGERAIV